MFVLMARWYEITCGADTVFHGRATLNDARRLAKNAVVRRGQPAVINRCHSPRKSKQREHFETITPQQIIDPEVSK